MPASPFEILHDDPRWVVVDKSAGIPVVSERGANPTRPLVEILSERFQAKIWVVHRLDRDTSGVMLFAKDRETHKALSRAFEGREVQKKYWAVVWGEVTSDGVVDQPLREFGSGRVGVDPKGKPSVTHYRVLRSTVRSTLLELEPTTGRRHQIRAHLYSIGHPVLGDMKYGHDRPVGGISRLMLHAIELTAPFPEGGVKTFHADPPAEFNSVS